MPDIENGLIVAFRLNGEGGGTRTDWAGVHAWEPGSEVLWIHLDYAHPEAERWLLEDSGLEATVAQALLAEETRPRSLSVQGGLLVILRGANFNSGAEPEDMLAIRVWLAGNRIITSRHRPLKTIDAIKDAVLAGEGPTDPGDFLVRLVDGLTTRMGTVLADLSDEIDALEDDVISAESYELRIKIGAFRRSAIRFRRYLAPQKDTILHLQNERVTWLTEEQRAVLREVGDRTLRFLEDLDAARDRAAVAQDELNGRLSDSMNKTMYVLSIVAGIFLPLGLLTGLLGINVGGMPGVESPWAFAIVCIILVGTAVFLTWFFKKKGWI